MWATDFLFVVVISFLTVPELFLLFLTFLIAYPLLCPNVTHGFVRIGVQQAGRMVTWY